MATKVSSYVPTTLNTDIHEIRGYCRPSFGELYLCADGIVRMWRPQTQSSAVFCLINDKSITAGPRGLSEEQLYRLFATRCPIVQAGNGSHHYVTGYYPGQPERGISPAARVYGAKLRGYEIDRDFRSVDGERLSEIL